MNITLHSEVFFFISSLGFITLWVLVAILLAYLIRIADTFHRIISKAERNIESVGDITKEVLEDVKDSTFFHFIFGKKKKTKK